MLITQVQPNSRAFPWPGSGSPKTKAPPMIPVPIAMLALCLIAGCSSGTNEAQLPESIRSYTTWDFFGTHPVSPAAAEQCFASVFQAAHTRYRSVDRGIHKDKFLAVFMNPTATQVTDAARVTKEGLESPPPFRISKQFLEGSTIVKEKRATPNAYAHAIGAMTKMAPGYDPEVGDWAFMYMADSGIAYEGRKHTQSCIACHALAADAGFVFGNYKKVQ